MPTYETLTDALTDLRGRGFTHNFNLEPDALHCAELDLRLHPEHFNIDEQYRFEGMSDPDDNDILYAISSDAGVKGVLVNAYGPYADSLSADMAAKLNSDSRVGK
jgi:hypothetical protein